MELALVGCCFNPNPTRERGILWDYSSLAYASGCDISFAGGKSIKSTIRHASCYDKSIAFGESTKAQAHSPQKRK
jgi:hypothetical protein